MNRKIISYFRAFCNWLQKTLADKCGDFPLGNTQGVHSNEPIEREIIVNNTKIHVRSIFTGKTSLDTAIKNIVTLKISDEQSAH